MTKSERTRQWIVEQTAPLFNRKGFEGTSLTDLTDATGLTKGALYGHFDDKNDIAKAAFRYSVTKVKRMVRERTDAAKTAKGQLGAVLDFFAAYVFNPPIPGGCPLLNTSIEADDHRIGMRRMVAKELVDTVDFLELLLRKGIRKGEFRKDIHPRQLAYTFFCSVEGALMFSRVERSKEPMNIIVSHCKNILEQISKQK